jgi:hypothetical protein
MVECTAISGAALRGEDYDESALLGIVVVHASCERAMARNVYKIDFQ